jgi:hypothetical protein
MFFGMCNLPAAFQQFMNAILEPWYQKWGCKREKNYMDDIGISTSLADKATHIKMVHNLFNILATHGLHLKLSKSIFLQPQMDFLRVWISKDGVTVDPTKVTELREYPRVLHNLKQVQGFLGCTGYHRIFCKNFSIITAPLFCLTKKDTPFV